MVKYFAPLNRAKNSSIWHSAISVGAPFLVSPAGVTVCNKEFSVINA